MRHPIRLCAACAAILLVVCAAQAAPQNPGLTAHVGEGDDSTEPSKALAISHLGLDVAIAGDTAHTVLTASFENSGPAALEGNFVFDLPPGSVVTGYALDVAGKMVDGVLAAKRQAKLVYEQRVRRGVDPGLAEVTRSGAFTTRVFPIVPGKGRTVRLEFVTPLDPDRPFAIPLITEKDVGDATIHVHLAGSGPAPAIEGPKGLRLRWTQGSDGYDAQAAFSKRALAGALTIAATAPPPPLSLQRHRSGDVFFEIDDTVAAEAVAQHPGRVRLYWDSSRSRMDQDLKPEIALAARYVDAAHPATLDVVTFADGKPQVKTLTAPSGAEVIAALQAVDYRGATSQAALLDGALAKAELCLLFSDGNMTVDSWRPQSLPCPLFAVSNAADADRGFLAALAQRSAGSFVDLRAQNADTALAVLTSATPRVAAVSDEAGHAIDYEMLTANGNRFRIVGPLPASGGIIVTLSQAAERTRRYAVDRSAIGAGNALAALWASAHDRAMNATDRPDKDALLAFERRYSVAGAASDFVVLETLDDYIDAQVEPPESFGHDAANHYRLLSKAKAANKVAAEETRLEKVTNLWNEQKGWWNTDFAAKPKRKQTTTKTGRVIDDSGVESVVAVGGRVPNAPVPPPPPSPPPPPPPPPPPSPRASNGQTETVVVTGQVGPRTGIYEAPLAVTAQREVRNDAARGPDIAIAVADWNPDRPYLKALDEAAPDKLWEAYRIQEKAHGGLPAFYLDVGEYLYRHGRKEDAVAVALNALDLPSADAATLGILADRLMRYGATERALWLYERIDYLEPDRPQPKRNLALALIARAEHDTPDAARADYARALELLAYVVTHQWDSKYDGIELISLMEANHIVPRLKNLGVKAPALDPRLIALLDVDLRVVLEWNTDETDMDLWVDEPSGERAIYNHPKTSIGGRLSNDMTNGYGPEEYLLHRAPSGAYTVRVNVYRTDRINPNGATTVRAHIFRNYGRADEEQQDLELELKRSAEGAQLVGVATVARGRK